MFKKSLLALALAGASLSATAAVTVTTNAAKDAAFPISKQGLPATGVYTLATSSEAIEIDFQESDVSAMTNTNFLVVEIQGGFFQNSSVNEVTDTNSRFAINTSKSTSTKLFFGLTGVQTSDVSDSSPEFVINTLNTLVASGSDNIQLKAYIETPSGLRVANTESSFKTVASITDQWSTKVDALDAKIDVSNDNETFVVETGNTATTDVVTFEYKTVGSGATPTGVTVTIKGDFEGVDSVSGFTINSDKTEATKVVTTSIPAFLAADDAVTFTIESGDDAVAQAEREFTVDVNVAYTDSESQPGTIALLDDASAGKWELNSSSITMDYAPFGPNTQLIVNATSTFSEDASVDVSYLGAEGKMVALTDVAVAAKTSVTKLGDKISEAILADTGATNGKTKIVVSVNAPEGKVTFFTGFKDLTDGSRMELQQVDTVAAATLSAAEAARDDLANQVDGLTALASDIADVDSSAPGAVSRVAAYVAAKVANTNEAYTAADLAATQAQCAAAGLNFETTSTSNTAVTAGASAATHGCY